MFNDDFIDALAILSFVIGLANYQENLTQSDKQDLLDEVNKATENAIKQVHQHLKEQDKKIDLILERLGINYEGN